LREVCRANEIGSISRKIYRITFCTFGSRIACISCSAANAEARTASVHDKCPRLPRALTSGQRSATRRLYAETFHPSLSLLFFRRQPLSKFPRYSNFRLQLSWYPRARLCPQDTVTFWIFTPRRYQDPRRRKSASISLCDRIVAPPRTGRAKYEYSQRSRVPRASLAAPAVLFAATGRKKERVDYVIV